MATYKVYKAKYANKIFKKINIKLNHPYKGAPVEFNCTKSFRKSIENRMKRYTAV